MEKKLDNIDKGYLSKDFCSEWVSINQNDSQWDERASQLEKALIQFGLPEHEVELIMARFVSNLTLDDIAEQFGYLSKQNTHYLVSEIKKKLSKNLKLRTMLLEFMKEKS